MRGPRAVTAETFAVPGGQDARFTPVSKSEAWLAEATAAKHVSSRCLKRTTVFEDLRQQAEQVAGQHLREAQTAPDQRMAALAFDDDRDEELRTPVRKRRRADAAAVSPEKGSAATPVMVRMKPTASAAAGKHEDIMVVLRGKAMLLAVASVPWLIRYLAQELEDGGVPVAEDGDGTQDAAGGTIF